MSLFCFTAPEGIPQWLLEPKGEMPSGWDLMSDPDDFDDVKTEL